MSAQDALRKVLDEVAGLEDRDVEEYTSRYEGEAPMRPFVALRRVLEMDSDIEMPRGWDYDYAVGYGVAIEAVRTVIKEALEGR